MNISTHINVRGVHQQAVSSLFGIFESLREGALAVEHEARVVFA